MPLDPDPNPNPNPGSQNVADPLDPGLKLKHCLKSLLRIRSARKTYQNFEQSSLSLPFLSTFYVNRSIFIKLKFNFFGLMLTFIENISIFYDIDLKIFQFRKHSLQIFVKLIFIII